MTASPLFAAPFLSFDAGGGAVSVALGDFNGDGKSDLATANAYSGTVSVLIGNADGTFRPKSDYETASNPQSIAVADLNGDGKLDLVTANPGTYPDYIGSLSVLLGNGDGTFDLRRDYRTGSFPQSVAIGDLNQDGKPDLTTANAGVYPEYIGSVSVLLGNGDGT